MASMRLWGIITYIPEGKDSHRAAKRRLAKDKMLNRQMFTRIFRKSQQRYRGLIKGKPGRAQ